MATKVEEPATLFSAMAAAFGEIQGATKAKQGQVGRQEYKYADLGSVIDAIKPALINHGLFFTQRTELSDGGAVVKTVLHHASGGSMDLGVLFVPANQNNAQGFGSALTYARRYALVTAFGVPTEDDDGSAASKTARAEPEKPPVQEAYADDPVDLISDEQAEWIINMLEQHNIPVAGLLKAGGVKTVSMITAPNWHNAKGWVEARIAEKGEGV
jgi:ERF superfamily